MPNNRQIIAELTEKRDKLRMEIEERKDDDLCRKRLIAQRAVAINTTGRPLLHYAYLQKEYLDTIYMNEPYLLETTAECCFNKTLENYFREHASRNKHYAFKSPKKYVLHCIAVIPGAQNTPHTLVLEDPYRQIAVKVAQERIPEHVEELAGKMLVVRLQYLIWEDKYLFEELAEILPHPFRRRV